MMSVPPKQKMMVASNALVSKVAAVIEVLLSIILLKGATSGSVSETMNDVSPIV